MNIQKECFNLPDREINLHCALDSTWQINLGLTAFLRLLRDQTMQLPPCSLRSVLFYILWAPLCMVMTFWICLLLWYKRARNHKERVCAAHLESNSWNAVTVHYFKAPCKLFGHMINQQSTSTFHIISGSLFYWGQWLGYYGPTTYRCIQTALRESLYSVFPKHLGHTNNVLQITLNLHLT